MVHPAHMRCAYIYLDDQALIEGSKLGFFKHLVIPSIYTVCISFHFRCWRKTSFRRDHGLMDSRATGALVLCKPIRACGADRDHTEFLSPGASPQQHWLSVAGVCASPSQATICQVVRTCCHCVQGLDVAGDGNWRWSQAGRGARELSRKVGGAAATMWLRH